jgi:hypothetical protein
VLSRELAGRGYRWGFPADVHVFDELWAYDISKDNWTVATRIPHPTCYCGLCALGDTVWVVGGGDDRAPGHRLKKDGNYERGINKIVGFRPSDGSWRPSHAASCTFPLSTTSFLSNSSQSRRRRP